MFSGWRNLAQGVHAYGSCIFIQLTPGLGRVGPPQCLLNELKLPVSASLNPNFYIPELPCLPLTDLALKKIIKNGAQAACDAKTAGLDGVYLHGHEGYLLDQLTSPAFNRRTAGRYAYWQNFGMDLIRAIRDTLRYMENLVKAGADMFDVDLGCYDNWWLPHPPASMPTGCFLPISRIAKNYFKARNIKSNAGIDVPIVAVGKLGYPDLAEQALRNGDCDLVMLGRQPQNRHGGRDSGIPDSGRGAQDHRRRRSQTFRFQLQADLYQIIL
ncbi:hypothetical protein MUB23_05305 [Cuneatibacter sp. NSJ-177]|uniref:oxidoreductase n=1 Tax=Cuneatibacter sp. NSJ-177 TaxID=2931401 RepID=UPI001FD4874E|nr:hypothetical protein [Cuneatibacter sp. NSJ-177]